MNEEVQRFVDAVPAETRPLFDQLRALVEEMYPGVEPALWYNLPRYKVKTGWVCLGYWKGGASLYTNSPDHIAAFKVQAPGVHTNKASINLKVGGPFPAEALRGVVRRAMGGRGGEDASANGAGSL
jgi:hypothetical protein